MENNNDTPEQRTAKVNEILLMIECEKIELNKIDQKINYHVKIMANNPINQEWVNNQSAVNRLLRKYNLHAYNIARLNSKLSDIKVKQGESFQAEIKKRINFSN